jgi:hypothetical protein
MTAKRINNKLTELLNPSTQTAPDWYKKIPIFTPDMNRLIIGTIIRKSRAIHRNYNYLTADKQKKIPQ